MNASQFLVRTSGQILSSCAPLYYSTFLRPCAAERGPSRVVHSALCSLPGRFRSGGANDAAGIFRVRGRSESMFISSDPLRRVHSLALSQLQRLSVVALKTVSDRTSRS